MLHRLPSLRDAGAALKRRVYYQIIAEIYQLLFFMLQQGFFFLLSFRTPLPSDASPRHHVCETDTVPSMPPLTPPQPQSVARSRLSTQGGNQSAVDSASAPRPKRSVRIADIPAVTQPRRCGGSLRISSPRLPSQPGRPSVPPNSYSSVEESPSKSSCQGDSQEVRA